MIAAPASTPAMLAARAATQTIPIVFWIGPDPVELGLVKSLNRPGGNLTGVASLTIEVTAKRLELIHELVPAADLIAVLVNPTNPSTTDSTTRELQIAARVLGVRLLILNASRPSDIAASFVTLVRERAGGLVIETDVFFYDQRDQIVALAARHAVPTISEFREFVAAGGLMAYGSNPQDAFSLVGNYTGRILKGEKAADLPVQLATKIELIINMKTARALDLTLPLILLSRADAVIE